MTTRPSPSGLSRTMLALASGLLMLASLLGFSAPAEAYSSAGFCQNDSNLECCVLSSDFNTIEVRSWDSRWARCQLPVDALDVTFLYKKSHSTCDGKWAFRQDLRTIAIKDGCRAVFGFNRTEDVDRPYPYSSVPPAPGANTRSYDTMRTVYFHDIGACARVRFTGEFRFTYSQETGHTFRAFRDIELNNPKAQAWLYQLENGRCTPRSKTVDELTISHAWSGWSCSFDPSVGVGFPWGVSVEGWGECGNKNVARYETTYFEDGSYYSQSSSGLKADFGTPWNNPFTDPVGPCFGGRVDLSAIGTSGVNADHGTTGEIRVCL